MPDHYLARTTAWQPAAPGQPRALGWAWWVCDRGAPARPLLGPWKEADARRVLGEMNEGVSDGGGERVLKPVPSGRSPVHGGRAQPMPRQRGNDAAGPGGDCRSEGGGAMKRYSMPTGYPPAAHTVDVYLGSDVDNLLARIRAAVEAERDATLRHVLSRAKDRAPAFLAAERACNALDALLAGEGA